MERSEQLNELAAALSRAQSKIRDAEKSGRNPHLKNAYATLGDVWDACRDALTSEGLSVAQLPVASEAGTVALETVLLHSSGQYLASLLIMPVAKPDAQSYGSALTYARRYGLSALLGICPEDDDGNAASAHLRQNSSVRPGDDRQRVSAPDPTLEAPRPHPAAESAVRASETRPSYANGAFDTGRAPESSGDRVASEQQTLPNPGEMACEWSGCGKSLTKGQFSVSERTFGGKHYCPEHQREAAKVAQ